MQVTAQIPSNVLFIVDVEDAEYLDISATSDHWNIVPEILDFNELDARVNRIAHLAKEHKTDFLLYSQNDQVAKRAGIGAIHQQLGLGYSSIGPIDRGEEELRREQTRTCYEDFLRCDRPFPYAASPGNHSPIAETDSGTFSIIFDAEQLGGIRYGLPRLLPLLARYDIRATFFVTNLVDRVYKNLFDTLLQMGHELAPHGLCHEHLAPLTQDEQLSQLRAMIELLGTKPTGANFIFRMNEDTVSALINAGLQYFVYFDTNYYRLISYPKRSTRPSLVENDEGRIWAIPVSVQTYGLPWFSIRNMLETATMQSRHSNFEHVSVLMHPFRDGSVDNLKTTERIIQHLLGKGLKPITLADLETKLKRQDGFAPSPCRPRQMLETHRPEVSLPSTRWDFIGFVPQTAISILQRIKGRPLF